MGINAVYQTFESEIAQQRYSLSPQEITSGILTPRCRALHNCPECIADIGYNNYPYCTLDIMKIILQKLKII